MYVLKKKLKPTCTAHYLGKDFPRACKNMHGHNYNYIIEVGFQELDNYDMGLDFAIIKEKCDNWLQSHWDHATVFSTFQKEAMEFWNKMDWHYEVFPIADRNTTAESMSEYLSELFYHELKNLYPTIKYVTMHIWETEGSEAQYTYRGEKDAD